MKRILGLVFLVSLTTLAFVSYAKTLYPVISLKQISAIKTAEKGGDELYLAVTVYPSDDKQSHYQIPKHPQHWLSKYINKINDLEVWRGSLTAGESVTVIIALVEHDARPWNTDDLIGELKLHISNDQGTLKSTWSVPNRQGQSPTVTLKKDSKNSFTLTGENSEYQLNFGVDMGETKP